MNEGKVFIMFADGFEEVEAITTADLLRRAGIDAVTVSIMGKREVPGSHGIPVITDILFEEADFNEAEMLVLPGGMPGTTNLLKHAPLKRVLLSFAAAGRPIAAICAAPMVLAEHGILSGRKATIYAGMEAYLKGALHTSGNVVKAGNIITSKGPGTAMDFGLALISFLRGEKKAEEIATGLLYKR